MVEICLCHNYIHGRKHLASFAYKQVAVMNSFIQYAHA